MNRKTALRRVISLALIVLLLGGITIPAFATPGTYEDYDIPLDEDGVPILGAEWGGDPNHRHKYQSPTLVEDCYSTCYIKFCDCGMKYIYGIGTGGTHHDFEVTSCEDGERKECRRCGYVCYMDRNGNYIDGVPSWAQCIDGHTYEEYTKPATCTESGETGKKCTVCGKVVRESSIQPLRHDYVAEITTPPAKDHTGIKTYTCSRCGDSYEVEIYYVDTGSSAGSTGSGSAKNPADSDSGSAKDPADSGSGTTPETGGDSGTQQKPSSGTQPGAGEDACANGHTWYYYNEDATCVQEGQKMRMCRVCGVKEVLGTIPKTGHKWEYKTTPATCEQDGDYSKVCSVCGEKEVISTYPKLGHKYAVSDITFATAGSAGSITRTCVTCGDQVTESTPAINGASVTTTGMKSGDLKAAALSRDEIVRLLANAPVEYNGTVYDEEPSVTAPYDTGSVNSAALQSAVDRLNAMRKLAGLPGVTRDSALCQKAQYGAVILAAIGHLDHYPSKPSDMDSTFYQQAKSATGSSNLCSGATLPGSVDCFMDDSDESNVARVGHRRWQLNPRLGKVGFGVAGSFVDEAVNDMSGVAPDYDFIGWPASGFFPGNQYAFGENTAWSVALNPSKYESPVLSAITVTVTRESDGRNWVLSGRESYTASDSGKFLTVDNANVGEGTCIIFRPDNAGIYNGVYTVEIDGLKLKNGSSAEFAYQVDFFIAGEQNPGTQKPSEWETTQPVEKPEENDSQTGQQNPGTNGNNPGGQQGQENGTPSGGSQGQTPAVSVFPDVPATHWAYHFVQTAKEAGLVGGYEDGTFKPDSTVTNAEFYVMMVNCLFEGKQTDNLFSALSGWFAPFAETLTVRGILDDTAVMNELYENGGQYGATVNSPINRYDMALIIYRSARNKGMGAASSEALADAEKQIGDWSSVPELYREAVANCYAKGLLNGTDEGIFDGSANMTRAQACAALCQLLNKFGS